MSDMTGELRQYVAETRRRAGLPANKDRPAETVTVSAGQPE